MKKNDRIIVILPVYNEGKSIYDLLKVYNSFFQEMNHSNYTIMIINDCSKDNTEDFIMLALNEFSNLEYIKHSSNKGLSGSLKTGFSELEKYNDYEIVVTMDGDNTHNPYLIKAMIDKLNEGADVVIASRYLEQSRIHGLSNFRILLSIGAKFAYKIRWRIKGVNDYTCNFRAYRGSVLKETISVYNEDFITEEGFTCTTEILRKVSNFSKINVEVPMILRYDNKIEVSNMKIFKTVMQTLLLLFKGVK